jgi:hypothetical protein
MPTSSLFQRVELLRLGKNCRSDKEHAPLSAARHRCPLATDPFYRHDSFPPHAAQLRDPDPVRVGMLLQALEVVAGLTIGSIAVKLRKPMWTPLTV